MKYRIGIDLGTTNIKAVLYDEDLKRVSMASAALSVFQDRKGYAEQHPDEVLEAFYKVMEEVLIPIAGRENLLLPPCYGD